MKCEDARVGTALAEGHGSAQPRKAAWAQKCFQNVPASLKTLAKPLSIWACQMQEDTIILTYLTGAL